MRENVVADPDFSSTDLPSKDLFKPFKTSISRLCFGCVSVGTAGGVYRAGSCTRNADRREIAGIASTMWTRSVRPATMMRTDATAMPGVSALT